ncbi:hypothetical protein ABNF97_30830 [Plantactinospora sp. B6F1]|uniref:hypothetical protein n=1 Tax=Plantactinospora sp. B6F1 TaxID=3158971 RepID=UPI00102C9FAA
MDSWLLLAVVLPLLVLLWTESSSAARRHRDGIARLRRVERKLDLVMEHLGLTDAEPVLPEVSAYLEKGQRIAAIKAYRDATGVGLREAKQAVDRIAERHGH